MNACALEYHSLSDAHGPAAAAARSCRKAWPRSGNPLRASDMRKAAAARSSNGLSRKTSPMKCPVKVG